MQVASSWAAHPTARVGTVHVLTQLGHDTADKVVAVDTVGHVLGWLEVEEVEEVEAVVGEEGERAGGGAGLGEGGGTMNWRSGKQ